MKILALDSSGLVASAAVVEDDITIAEYTINHKKTHSQTLLPMLDELRRMTELDLHTLDAIAVAAGPGSFTGLRIGSATAKGLGLALDIPIIPVPTVDALAFNLYGSGGLVCPIMDARRNQVYTGLYAFHKGAEQDARYDMCTMEKQCAVDIAWLAGRINELDRETVFLGDGVSVYRDQLAELLRVRYSLHRRAATGRGLPVWLRWELFYMRRGSQGQRRSMSLIICAFHRQSGSARKKGIRE